MDRTDFTEEHLKTEPVATGPHSEVEVAWIFPENPDGKLPVGGSTDLLVALSNSGSKMFNVSRVEGKLLTGDGKLVVKLPSFEYGQPLGPREQRSFRFPIVLEEEAKLGEFTLTTSIYYNSREKDPFLAEVCKETVEVVPPLPSVDAQLRMLQVALGVVGLLIVVLLAVRGSSGGGSTTKVKKSAAEDPSGAKSNEWLAGTLAHTEGKVPKKNKKFA